MLHVIHVIELHLRDKNLNLSLITDFKYHQKERKKRLNLQYALTILQI